MSKRAKRMNAKRGQDKSHRSYTKPCTKCKVKVQSGVFKVLQPK